MTVLADLFRLAPMQKALQTSPLVFVDAGAAVGVEEPWLSLVANDAYTRVVAFEPHPENFAGIQRLANGNYHQLAIGEQRGLAKFYLAGTASSLEDRSQQMDKELRSIEVEVHRLDELRSSGIIPSIDVLKTDTECTDYESICSAGSYLDSEVLAVQAEFSIHGSELEKPFRLHDALLQSKGFQLIGLSLQRGSMGEIAGGNYLYIRSIFDLMSRRPENLQTKCLKLFAIAVGLSHLDTAYAIARAVDDHRVFDDDTAKKLREFALSWVYVPDTLPFSMPRVRLATVLGNLTAVVGGGFSRGVSTPEANRLENYRKLVRRPSWFAKKETAAALYEQYYREAAREAAAIHQSNDRSAT